MNLDAITLDSYKLEADNQSLQYFLYENDSFYQAAKGLNPGHANFPG